MKTLAISVARHNSSIALLFDNKLITTYSCERIHRQKHSGNVRQGDLDIIAEYTMEVDLLVLVNIDPQKQEEIENKIAKSGIFYKRKIIDNHNHHLFHAAASYYPLGLDDAVCIVVDGLGSAVNKNIAMLAEVTSFFEARDTIKTLYKKFFFRKYGSPSDTTARPGLTEDEMQKIKQSFKYPVELSSHLDTGEMYGTISRYIGFHVMDGGKTMGLSAYGEPNNLPPILIPGTCITNNNLFRNDKQIDLEVNPQLSNPDETTKCNMAFNVQRALEEMFIEKVQKALTLSTSKNIIISGGCALNILGNSLIKKTFKDYNVYVEPIATDSAQSLGAAYYYYKKFNPNAKFEKFNDLYHGPVEQIDRSDVERLVEHYNESTNPPK